MYVSGVRGVARRARRHDRQRAVDVDAAGHRPRPRLLGKQGSIGSPAHSHREQRHPRSSMRAPGQQIMTFGTKGFVDMRVGAPRRNGGPNNSPGRVFENLLIVGSNVGEGYGSPPGDIRAYDVLTGKLVWTFHTIPRPGEYGYETWPEDRLQVRRRREHVGRSHARREERHRVSADRIADARSLRRRSSGRQPVRQLPARARRADGKAAVAFPDRASRSVGLRQRRRAQAADRAAQRQADRDRRAGGQDRISVCVRAENGKAAVAN